MQYYVEVISHVGLLAILALSLNTICGLTGLLHLGQAGFYAVGAYAAGVYVRWAFTSGAWESLPWPVHLLVCIVLAVAVAMVFALVIGLPCLRLKGDYLAIATLGFGEVVRLCIENIDPLGGPRGLSLAGNARVVDWWLIWIFVAITWLLLVNLKQSAVGRAMLAIRQDEVAARSMGVNVSAYKTLSFLLCAAFAGLAGALFMLKTGFAAPGTFDLLLSIEVLLVVVLGGLGSYSGALLAAAVIVVGRELLGSLDRIVPDQLGAVDSFAAQLGQQRELLFAILLVVLVRFVPNGFLGLKEFRGGPRLPVGPSSERAGGEHER